MKPITKILVVMNPNQTIEQSAVQRAILLANALGAQLELYACLRETLFLPNRFYSHKDSELAQQEEYARIQQVLNETCRQLCADGIQCAWAASVDKSQSHGVLKHVSRTRPQLVIKETGYHPKIARAIYSHADWDLIRQCPVPLWLSKEGDWPDNGKIVACIDPIHPDDSDAKIDREIVQLSTSLGDALAASVEVFHAHVPLSDYAKPFVIDAIVQKIKDEYTQCIDDFLKQFQLPPDHVHLVDGVVEKILDGVVKKLNGGVVVLGAFARHGVSKMLLGSTAERVLDRVSCDVLVVKPPGYETDFLRKSQELLPDDLVAN